MCFKFMKKEHWRTLHVIPIAAVHQKPFLSFNVLGAGFFLRLLGCFSNAILSAVIYKQQCVEFWSSGDYSSEFSGFEGCISAEGGQGFNFHASSSQTINIEDSEFWIGSGSFGDPLIENSPAMMQTAERRKRQNCGNSFHGHQHRVFGGNGQIGLGSNLTVAAEGHVSHSYGPLFAGVQGGMTQGTRLHTSNFQLGGSEAGSSFSLNDERSATNTCWNAVLPGSEEGTLQHPMSNPAGNFTNNFHPYMNDESRNSYKRKISVDSSGGSLTSRALSGQRDRDFVGFPQVSGARRLDTSMNSAYDESQLTRDSHNAFQSLRTSAMHHSQNERANRYDGVNTSWTQESYRSPCIIGGLPSQASMPRRVPTTMIGSAGNNMAIGLPEILSFRQGNGLSATGNWCANSTFVDEGNNQSGFGNDGNQPRHNLSEALDMIGISSVDNRLPRPPNQTSRSVYVREFNSQASHASHRATPNPYVYGGTVDLQPPAISAAQPLSRFNNVHPQGGMLRFPPPGSAAALNSIMSGSQATYGDAYPSFATMPGPAMAPLLPRYNDTNRASYVHQVSLRGQRALPSEGMNRHRFVASHELFNQSLVYSGGDWADIHDQHSNMRLDVDNMSYEELLALEERIGNVNTGLSDDNVEKCLKTSTYSCSDATSGDNSQESDVKCSICQEEYMEGDELGQLDCGHGYHTACIKQWLVLKNQCPICKAGACSET